MIVLRLKLLGRLAQRRVRARRREGADESSLETDESPAPVIRDPDFGLSLEADASALEEAFRRVQEQMRAVPEAADDRAAAQAPGAVGAAPRPLEADEPPVEEAFRKVQEGDVLEGLAAAAQVCLQP